MKSITVDIEEDEFEELDIQSNHLSLNDLEKKLLVHRIRKNTSKMHEIALQNEGRYLNEEEIFDMVQEIKHKIS